jgi:sugar-specific transcriptional regulator TrmB
MAILQFKRGSTFIDPKIGEPFLDTNLNSLKVGISGSDFITLLDSGSLTTSISPLTDRLDSIELTTASLNTSVSNLNSFTQSFNTAISLDSSNVTILGDLNVQGTTTTIDSTTITLGDNIIELNGTGAANGGILVNDVTNPNTLSGSLLWDGTNDYWKAGQLGSENEIITTANIVSNLPDGIKSGSGQVIFNDISQNPFESDSNGITASNHFIPSTTEIYDLGSENFRWRSLYLSGSTIDLGGTLISINDEGNVLFLDSASQEAKTAVVDYSSITSLPTLLSGSSQVDVTQTTNYSSINQYSDTKVKTKLDAEGVISGSSQVDVTQTTNYSSINQYTDSDTQDYLDSIGVVSGSISGQLPSGTVSGSSQIDHDQTTNYSAAEHFLQSEITTVGTVTVGSVTAILPSGTVSGSSQIDITGGLPSGTVSGSSQIDVTQTTNYSSINQYTDSDFDTRFGTKSTSDLSEGTNEYYTDTKVKTKLDVEGVISGSSQVDVTQTTNYSSINQYTDSDTQNYIDSIGLISGSVSGQLPSGTVSGSSQIDHDQTLNFSTDEHFTQENITTLGTVTVGSVTAILPSGTVSGSSQINITGGLPAGTVSGSEQIDHDLTLNFSSAEHYTQENITTVGTVTTGNVDGILPSGTVSGSIQVDVTQTTNYSSINQYTDSDTQDYIDSIGLVSGSVSGQLPSGTVSGSSQVNMGGDISGDATNATVEKVQGVSLTSGEATQLANIDTNTISNTQWGYLGVMNQNVRTTDNVTFNTGSFTGDVTINGNFTVLGSVTEISTTELTVEDKLITIASGSADSAAANGAGIFIDGANESITWNHSNSRFNISDDLNVEGNVTVTGDVVAFSSSDRRFKDNLTQIVTPLSKLSQINGYSFNWNTDKQHIYKGKDYGVVAQEIQEVLPELVKERENGYLAVNYEKLVPLLIESIKELKTQIDHLNKKLEK